MRYLLIPFALSACAASGDDSRATRALPVPGAFDAVTLGGPDDVRVVTGGAPSISATGRAADLDRLDIRLEGSTLIVSRKNDTGGWMRWNNGRGVTVTVTTPRPIGGAAIRGSGDLDVDRGGGARFAAELKGSGDLTVARLDTATARLALSGSGDIRVAGRARAVEADLSGSGGIDASGLAAEAAAIDLRGSGEVRARATRAASIALRGSGDATVTGTANCTIDKRGSGEARCTP